MDEREWRDELRPIYRLEEYIGARATDHSENLAAATATLERAVKLMAPSHAASHAASAASSSWSGSDAKKSSERASCFSDGGASAGPPGRVPRVHRDATTRRGLATEWVDGATPLAGGAAAGGPPGFSMALPPAARA